MTTTTTATPSSLRGGQRRPRYSGGNATDVSVTNTDDDTAGITVTPTTGLATTEAGGTATFTVVLNTQPTADVTIARRAPRPDRGTCAGQPDLHRGQLERRRRR